MYRTIVAGTDGSSTAQEAVAHACALAAATGASLHVVSAYAATPPAGPPSSVRALPDQRGRADAVLEHCLMRLPAGGARLRVQARPGEARDVLLSVVDEVSADLLVLGTDAREDAPAGLARRVAAGARCAVLLVRPAPS